MDGLSDSTRPPRAVYASRTSRISLDGPVLEVSNVYDPFSSECSLASFSSSYWDDVSELWFGCSVWTGPSSSGTLSSLSMLSCCRRLGLLMVLKRRGSKCLCKSPVLYSPL